MTVTLYPPFTPGWWYQGATYASHSDYAVDWNRRTQNGGWLEDRGDPVLACADGTVAQVTKAEGLVMLDHGPLVRTEMRHMTNIPVKVGQKVTRGQRIGNIGDVGNSTAPHLHLRQWRRSAAGKPWQPTQLVLMGEPIRVSVLSDQKPADWKPPTPVMVQGQPLPESPEETIARLRERLDAQKAQTALATDERDQARRDLAVAVARIKELEAAPDCHDVQDEAVRLRDIVDKVRGLVSM